MYLYIPVGLLRHLWYRLGLLDGDVGCMGKSMHIVMDVVGFELPTAPTETG